MILALLVTLATVLTVLPILACPRSDDDGGRP